MNSKNSVGRHPVGIFMLAAFAISWAGSLVVGGPFFLRGASMPLEDLLVVGILVVAGPFVAGLAMTGFIGGRPGLRSLASRMARWQVQRRWYAALLIFPVLLFATSLALSATVSPELSPIFFTPGIMVGLLAGIIEETGWMGFAYPMMRARWSAMRTSLYLGILHALWHIVPDFLGNYHSLGSYWFLYFLGFSVFVVALRVVIVWVYANTGSLLMAQLMHASSTGFLATLIPTDVTPKNWAIFYCVYAVVLTVTAALVVTRPSWRSL